MIILFTATFILQHGFIFPCVFLVPFVIYLTKSPNTENPDQNIRQEVDDIVSKIIQGEKEPANYLTQALALVWPKIFTQSRVDYFKDCLQYVIEKNPVPYLHSLQLTNLHLGEQAPQIVMTSLPQKPDAAESSLVIQIQAIYYPTFELSSIVKPIATSPSFNVKFIDINVLFDTYIQFEFATKEVSQMPFWTALDFSLPKPPIISGFNVTLNSNSSIINKDSLKDYLSSMIGQVLLNLCGMPNGFLWERCTGKWCLSRVFGTNSFLRCSLSTTEMIRIGRLKDAALALCETLCLPYPLNIQTEDYKDETIDTVSMEKMTSLILNCTINNVTALCDEFSINPPSPDELEKFLHVAHDFIITWFKDWTAQAKKAKIKDPSIDEKLASVYTYVNFLNLQKKVNWEVADKLGLDKKVSTLEEMILSFHSKFFKKTS